ncbi:MAG: glycosyltransferase [bacterium]|nr:glycosyltransferase [bacterium]
MNPDERKRYDRNASVLRKTRPGAFARVAGVSAAEMEAGEAETAITSARATVERALNEGMDFLYLLGAGEGELFECLPAVIAENRGVMVIEPDPARLARVMTRRDLRELFRSERVFWNLGPDVRKGVETVWHETLAHCAAKPFIQFGGDPRNDARLRQLLDVKSMLEQEIPRRKAAMVERLQNLPLRMNERKQAGSRPQTIWTYSDLRTSARYSIIQHVLIRTLFFYLRGMGFDARYLVMKPGRYYPPYYRILELARAKPDALFLCNQSPSYEVALGAEFSRSLPIPKIVWFADDPFYAEHFFHRHGVTPDERFLVADYGWAETLTRHGAREVGYMPGAATQTRRGPRRAGRGCEVVFVGQVRWLRPFLDRLPPDWRRYAEQVIEAKLANPRADVREAMTAFPMPAELPYDRLDELRQNLLWEANTRYRVRLIQSLRGFDLHLYGNADWERLLPPEMTARCFKGIAPFKRLFEIYRNARVTLNIHSMQSYTCLNVRDFDAPAAGGFLLSDWLPRADEVFTPGTIESLPLAGSSDEEVFFYRDAAEMHTLIEYFLANEDHRLACVERARARVIEHHTYAKRAADLAGFIRHCLSQQNT